MPRQVITLHHTLRDAGGHLFDTSQGGQAITYLEGSGAIIDGLEEALRGLPAGARKKMPAPTVNGTNAWCSG